MCAISINSYDWDWSESEGKRPKPTPLPHMRLWFFFQKMSHSAEKCKRGDPLAFINIYSIVKFQKTRKEDSFETLKNFWKKSHLAEKKSNLSVSSGFVGYGEKVKNERWDPFALISADRTWPLMLVVLVVSIVRKVAQSEWDCSLTKKKEKKLATVRVGHYSLEKRRLKMRAPESSAFQCQLNWTNRVSLFRFSTEFAEKYCG